MPPPFVTSCANPSRRLRRPGDHPSKSDVPNPTLTKCNSLSSTPRWTASFRTTAITDGRRANCGSGNSGTTTLAAMTATTFTRAPMLAPDTRLSLHQPIFYAMSVALIGCQVHECRMVKAAQPKNSVRRAFVFPSAKTSCSKDYWYRYFLSVITIY